MSLNSIREVNFDGLVGLTHNYSGLAHGNVASMSHGGLVSNPKEGALQGLAKMKSLMDAGYAQGVLPPQQRPDLGALRDLGFTGSDREMLARAAKQAPQLLRAVCSASSMWTANAGTITPSVDAPDGRVHFTPANLQSSFHRYLEPKTTGRVLQAIFRDEQHFAHHPVLPATPAFSDEGAANHTRLCGEYGEPGVHLFVYGRQAFSGGRNEPKRYPARQTLEASQAVARQHDLTDDFASRQVANELLRACVAERTGQRATDLRRHAERAAILFGDIDHLDLVPARDADEVLTRAIGRNLLRHQFGHPDFEMLVEKRAVVLRQVGHVREIAHTLLVDPLPDLTHAHLGLFLGRAGGDQRVAQPVAGQPDKIGLAESRILLAGDGHYVLRDRGRGRHVSRS